MGTMIATALLLSLVSTQLPTERTLEGKSGAHSYRVRLATRPFDPKGRKVQLGTEDPPEWTKVDGRRIWGLEYGPSLPDTELAVFEASVDGIAWKLPKTLWFDCFEVHLDEALQVWLSKDGSRLAVKAFASDGAGGYTVLWRLQQNGKHSREIYLEGVLAEKRKQML